MNSTASHPLDLAQLDALTGGAFTAPTSGERAARVRDWLATEPSAELMQAVFKELSVKDKGAARPLRERLDELRRAKAQEALAAQWAERARALLAAPRFSIADALAWQRDAARAGAPLSREPLAGLRAALAERIKAVEDLQNQVMVLREASVLLAQRIEILSTRSWKDAQAAAPVLREDVARWLAQVEALRQQPDWSVMDPKYAPMLDAAQSQLQIVWDAFTAALAQAEAAAADPSVAPPPVPVWAAEIRAARGESIEAPDAERHRPKVDPAERQARREAALAAVVPLLERLEREVAEGHGKASAGVAAALREAFKTHARHLEAAIESRVHAALAAAGELEGWARWRADQIREELIQKAQALVDGEHAPQGRKLQEALRALREQWKATDQSGVPNHALWKRFDEACTAAHARVEAWLEQVRAEAAAHRAERLALIDEVKAWTEAQAQQTPPDWKAQIRALAQFAERWRKAGHLSEKAFAELQPLWKAAIGEAGAALAKAQEESLQRRQALIQEAQALAQEPVLRVDAVRSLQQRWQAEAQAVPLDRRAEQKLWEAFRKPIDEAFARKGSERARVEQSLSERDRAVIEAARALEAANASGDAQRIRAAMAALEAAVRGGSTARTAAAPAGAPLAQVLEEKQPNAGEKSAPDATKTEVSEPAEASGSASTTPAKPVVAVRGDDRPGARRSAPESRAGAGAEGLRGRGRDGGAASAGGGRREARPTFGRGSEPERAPRLGDAAFRAQREALEHAEATLRRLAAQAHGEALTQLLHAWELRDPQALPGAQALGRAVSAGVRAAWVKALGAPPSGDAAEALLRLEIAAEVPTPAAQLDARRALQLKLLTRRHDPAPAETWPQDVATVLASAWNAEAAQRLQSALKVLLRRG